MASIKVVLRLNKIKTNGEAPLYLRIIQDRKARFMSLGYSINPHYWDKKNNCIKRSHPNSSRLNSFIAHKHIDAKDMVLQAELDNKYVGVNSLKQKVMGKNQTSFIAYIESYLEKLNNLEKVSSYKKCSAIKKKLVRYLGSNELLFKEIDVNWLLKYEEYMMTTLRNSQNTVHSNLKLFRKLFNDAIKEDLIPEALSPFKKFKLKWEKKDEKTHLKEVEIDKLRNLKLERGTMLDMCRNMFLFSCYSGGLRISDLLMLKWKNFDGNAITFRCFKTGEQQNIKVPTIGIEILNIYHQGDWTSNPNAFIFPLMANVPFQTPAEKHNAFSRITSVYNKNLKIIAKKAELSVTQISSHWARRTFTCLALEKGMTLDVVSKILGHSGERITVESYAVYSESNLYNEMDKLNN